MRTAQKDYFRTRSQKALRESMMLERDVDGEIKRVKDIEQDKINQKLFK
jgi:hypothetical protein